MADQISTSNNTIVGSSYSSGDLEALQKRVDALNSNLRSFNTNPTTADELRQRAENEYNPIYNAQVGEQEALKDSAQSALNQRLSALERQFGRNSEQLGRSYDAQRVAANNTMLARGLNNSSLAAAMLNRVEDQRNRALADLTAERAASETAAQDDYANAVRAADAAIARLGTDRATNIDARYQALRDADQNRVFQAQQAQNALTQYMADLMLQIESLRQQGYSQYLQAQQLNAKSGGGGGGSSGGSGRSSSTATSAQNASAQNAASSLADTYNSTVGGTSNPANIVKGVADTFRSAGSAAKNAVSSMASALTGGSSKKSSTLANAAKALAVPLLATVPLANKSASNFIKSLSSALKK